MNESIDKRESNKYLIISGIIVFIFVVGLFTNGFGFFGKKQTEQIINNSPVNFIPLNIGQSPVLGDLNAPLIIYEFSDFSCPFCAAVLGYNPAIIKSLKSTDPSWEAPLPKIKEEYIETGRAKLVFKYSLGHGTGKEAHRVGWCLNDQDLFWQFHEQAFAKSEDTPNLEKMKEIAKNIGADVGELESCLAEKKYESFFEKDSAMGRANGVQGTPAFFINGKLVSGAKSFNEIKKIIDKELTK